MIDPTDVTKFDRTVPQLEEFLLFCIIVAGKRARMQAPKLHQFLTENEAEPSETPFSIIRKLHREGRLLEAIQSARLGQYTRLARCFEEVSKLNPATCTTDDLEAITGIGPKTSRYFLLHSRKGTRAAVLDRHILRWMGEKFGINVPSNTPPAGKNYNKFEKAYLDYCDQNQVSPADLDLAIWNKLSEGKDTPGVPV